jgi:major type 1 subunit fimbrin (pilin)
MNSIHMNSIKSSGRGLVVAAAILAAPLSCLASDGTVTITGSVTAETCTTITNTGGQSAGASFTVQLPNVSKGTLSVSPFTAGSTKFSLVLSGCTITTSGNLFAYFENGPNVNAAGRLTSGVSNVDIELLDSSGNTTINLSQNSAGQGSAATNRVAVTSSTTSATLTYYAQYRGTGTPGTGAVNTSVNYTIVYP